jgi:peptidoglycan/LPS O-acetylase OafA/YrhL
VAVLAIVASIVWSEQIESALSSRRKVVRFLGLLTYPLYLVHEDMGRAVMVAMRGIGAFGALAIGMVVVVAVSILVTLIEKHVQAYIGGRFAVRTSAAQLP